MYTGYTGVFRHFYMTHVHILKGRNSTLSTFVGGESYRGDAYTNGEKAFFEITLFCFLLVFSLFYGALSYALLLSLHCVFVSEHTCALVGSCS